MGLDFPPMAKGRVPKAGVLFHKVCHHTMKHWEPPILYLWDWLGGLLVKELLMHGV